MDRIVEGNVGVCGKTVIGCQRNKLDIMLTFMEKREEGEKTEFHDWFLTQTQAKDLVTELQNRINYNENTVV